MVKSMSVNNYPTTSGIIPPQFSIVYGGCGHLSFSTPHAKWMFWPTMNCNQCQGVVKHYGPEDHIRAGWAGV